MSTEPHRSEKPHDRLTGLCAAMTAALDAHPDYTPDVRCVVFLQDGERGGLQMHGYERDAEALADVLHHLRAIFEANGQEFHVGVMPHPPGHG